MPANLWESNYKNWPIEGDIKLQYFEGLIIKREDYKKKEYFTIQWLNDDTLDEMTLHTIQRHAIWEKPNRPGLVITADAWKQATTKSKSSASSSTLQRTLHVDGKQTTQQHNPPSFYKTNHAHTCIVISRS